MKIVIKNIGKVRDASICIEGITVIGGKNGTGKSTISRAFPPLKPRREMPPAAPPDTP